LGETLRLEFIKIANNLIDAEAFDFTGFKRKSYSRQALRRKYTVTGSCADKT
jgi:hypothetical protein